MCRACPAECILSLSTHAHTASGLLDASWSPLTRLRVLDALRASWQDRWGGANHTTDIHTTLLISPTQGVSVGTSDDHQSAQNSLRALAAQELVLAVRAAAARATGQTSGLCQSLGQLARVHRLQGAVATGLSDLQLLRDCLTSELRRIESQPDGAGGAGSSGGPAWLTAMCHPAAPWRLEEARLRWHMGEARTAAHMAYSVAEIIQAVRGQPAGHPALQPARAAANAQQTVTSATGGVDDSVCSMQLATALSLAGVWAAEAQVRLKGIADTGASADADTRGAGSVSGDVLDALTQAAQIAQQHLPQPAQPGQPAAHVANAAACEVFYRLAHYADQLYRANVEQRSTPEYVTYTRVIQVGRLETCCSASMNICSNMTQT